MISLNVLYLKKYLEAIINIRTNVIFRSITENTDLKYSK